MPGNSLGIMQVSFRLCWHGHPATHHPCYGDGISIPKESKEQKQWTTQGLRHEGIFLLHFLSLSLMPRDQVKRMPRGHHPRGDRGDSPASQSRYARPGSRSTRKAGSRNSSVVYTGLTCHPQWIMLFPADGVLTEFSIAGLTARSSRLKQGGVKTEGSHACLSFG